MKGIKLKDKKIKILKIILTIIVLVAITGLIIYLTPIMIKLYSEEGRIEFRNKVNEWKFLGFLALFGLQVEQIFLFIIPGEPIEILSGMCYWGVVGSIFIITSAAIISTGIFFTVRKLGKKFVYNFCNEKKVQKIENSKLFQNPRRVEKIMLILFLIPGTPKDLLVYISGLLPIKPLRFIIISTVARIPSVISSTFAGANLAKGDWKMSIIIYLAIVIPVMIAIYIMNKFDKEKLTDEALKIINK